MADTGLTDQELDVLRSLEYWHRSGERKGARPLDLGGRNGSHHSATLNKLVRRGLVSRKARSPLTTRGSYRYSLTDLGQSTVKDLGFGSTTKSE